MSNNSLYKLNKYTQFRNEKPMNATYYQKKINYYQQIIFNQKLEQQQNQKLEQQGGLFGSSESEKVIKKIRTFGEKNNNDENAILTAVSKLTLDDIIEGYDAKTWTNKNLTVNIFNKFIDKKTKRELDIYAALLSKIIKINKNIDTMFELLFTLFIGKNVNEYQLNIDKESKMYMFHYAVSLKASSEIIKKLVEKGCKYDKVDNNQKLPINYALENKDKKMCELLLDMKYEDNTYVKILFDIIETNNKDILEFLLNHSKININLTNKDRKTPLLVAIEKSNVDLAKLFIKNKSTNFSLPHNVNLLKVGFEKNNSKIVDLLVKNMNTNSNNTINPNEKYEDGNTLLMMAINNNNVEMIKLLLGCNTLLSNQANNNGDTPLIKSLKDEKYDIVKILFKHHNKKNKIDPNVPNQKNQYETPLKIAIDKQNINIINLLLDEYANPNTIVDEKGTRPLQYVLNKYNTLPIIEDIIKSIVKRKDFDFTFTDIDGYSSLYTAIYTYPALNSSVLSLLLEANKKAQNKKELSALAEEDKTKKNSPLHIAIDNTNDELFSYIMKNYKDSMIDKQNAIGYTPLFMCVNILLKSKDSTTITKLNNYINILLQNKCNTMIVDKDGNTVLHPFISEKILNEITPTNNNMILFAKIAAVNHDIFNIKNNEDNNVICSIDSIIFENNKDEFTNFTTIMSELIYKKESDELKEKEKKMKEIGDTLITKKTEAIELVKTKIETTINDKTSKNRKTKLIDLLIIADLLEMELEKSSLDKIDQEYPDFEEAKEIEQNKIENNTGDMIKLVMRNLDASLAVKHASTIKLARDLENLAKRYVELTGIIENFNNFIKKILDEC